MTAFSQDCISLYELNSMVRYAIESSLCEPVWIQAELSSVSVRNGHCFLEFVQKAEQGNTFIAKAKGQIWASRWMLIRPYFEQTTSQPLSPGMQVMVRVEPTFHEQFGYSLNVVDINPSFTLGDIARKRQEILRQLEEEGILTLNKELDLPLLTQRIAVVSSDGAAGWGDFQNQLLNNQYGLAFHLQLFPAIMQGERVEASIIAALNQIAEQSEQWDVVVIVRGGGATSDLTGFDTLLLAEHVAQFPLPVITGIGHERDDTVLDIISHTRVKTPTAAAEFLVQHQLQQMQRIETLKNNIADFSRELIRQENLRIERLTGRIPTLWQVYRERQVNLLDNHLFTIQTAISSILERQAHKLEVISTQLRSADPVHLLKLGYSIARHNGKAVKDASMLKSGDKVEITLEKGTVTTTVS